MAALPTDAELDAAIRHAFGASAQVAVAMAEAVRAKTPRPKPPRPPKKYQRVTPAACQHCRRLQPKDGQPCKRHGGPSRRYVPVPMARQLGGLRMVAQKIGLSMEEYARHRQAGELWCFRCRAWHSAEAFGIDKTRSSGRTAGCKAARNARARAQYHPKAAAR